MRKQSYWHVKHDIYVFGQLISRKYIVNRKKDKKRKMKGTTNVYILKCLKYHIGLTL